MGALVRLAVAGILALLGVLTDLVSKITGS